MLILLNSIYNIAFMIKQKSFIFLFVIVIMF